MKKSPSPVMAVRIPRELRSAAERLVTDGGTLSDVIRAAVAEYVQNHQKRDVMHNQETNN